MFEWLTNIFNNFKSALNKFIGKTNKDEHEETEDSETKHLRVRKRTGLRDLESWEEEEIIEDVADRIVKYGLDLPSVIMLQSITPLSEAIGNLFILPVSPVLDFFGIPGHLAASFFQKRENIERLIKRIEEKEASKKK